MTRSETETVLAAALCLAGRISSAYCLQILDRARLLPDFPCQDARNWKLPPARSACACGNLLKHSYGPCERCRAEHFAMYEPGGKRRVFGLTDND